MASGLIKLVHPGRSVRHGGKYDGLPGMIAMGRAHHPLQFGMILNLQGKPPVSCFNSLVQVLILTCNPVCLQKSVDGLTRMPWRLIVVPLPLGDVIITAGNTLIVNQHIQDIVGCLLQCLQYQFFLLFVLLSPAN